MLMEVKKEIRLLFQSVKYNIMRQMANPLSFVLNVLFMILNNSAFLVEWAIFFTLKDSIGGYGFKEVCLLWGISAASFGLAHIFFHGAFKMPKLIEEGGLDQYLLVPRDTLLATISSQTSISAIGDLLYGLIVSIIFYHSIVNIILILLFSILGAIIYTAFAVIINTLAFRFIKLSDFAENIVGMFITFSLYPEEIFDTVIKVILYILIPIGFAVYIPMDVLLEFNLINLIIVISYTIFISLIAYYLFNRGLKRYSSSNLAISR